MSFSVKIERFGAFCRVTVSIDESDSAAAAAASSSPYVFLVVDVSSSMRPSMENLHKALHTECPESLQMARAKGRMTTIAFNHNASVISNHQAFMASGGTSFSSFLELLNALIATTDEYEGAHIIVLTDGHDGGHISSGSEFFRGSGKSTALKPAGRLTMDAVRDTLKKNSSTVHFIGLTDEHDVHGLNVMMEHLDQADIHSTFNYASDSTAIAANVGDICGEIADRQIEIVIGEHVHRATVPSSGPHTFEFVIPAAAAADAAASGGAAASAAAPKVLLRFIDEADPDDESGAPRALTALPTFSTLSGTSAAAAEIEALCAEEVLDHELILRKIASAIAAAKSDKIATDRKKTITRLFNLATFVHSSRHEASTQTVRRGASATARAALELAERRGAGRTATRAQRLQEKLANRLAGGKNLAAIADAIIEAKGRVDWALARFPKLHCNFSLESFKSAVRDGSGLGICVRVNRDIPTASPGGVAVADPSQFPLDALEVEFQPIDIDTADSMSEAAAAAGSLSVFGGDGHGLLAPFDAVLPLPGCEETWPVTEIVMRQCVGQIVTGAPEGFAPAQLYTIPYLILIRAVATASQRAAGGATAAAAGAAGATKFSEHDAVFIEQIYRVCAHYCDLAKVQEHLYLLNIGEMTRADCPSFEVFVGHLMTAAWMAENTKGSSASTATHIVRKMKTCGPALAVECARRLARLPHGSRASEQVREAVLDCLNLSGPYLTSAEHSALIADAVTDADAAADDAAAGAAAAAAAAGPDDPITFKSLRMEVKKRMCRMRDARAPEVPESCRRIARALDRGQDILEQIEQMTGLRVTPEFWDIAYIRGLDLSESLGLPLEEAAKIAADPGAAHAEFRDQIFNLTTEKLVAEMVAEADAKLTAEGNARWYVRRVFPGLPQKPEEMTCSDYHWVASKALTLTFPSGAPLAARFHAIRAHIAGKPTDVTPQEDLDFLVLQALEKPELLTESEQFWLLTDVVARTGINTEKLDYFQLCKDYKSLSKGMDTALKLWWLMRFGYFKRHEGPGSNGVPKHLTEMGDPYWHG